jgi:CMP/dCMP kinase
MGKIIAVDGTAGSGKTTIARKLARTLAAPHISAGLLYRYSAWKLELNNPDLTPEVHSIQFSDLLSSAALSLREVQPLSFFLHVNDIRLPDEIESEAVAQRASLWAQQTICIQAAHEVLERITAPHELCVIDGREIAWAFQSSIIASFFVDAPLSMRAYRCHKAQESRGVKLSQDECAELLQSRDLRDANREAFPFTLHPNARSIDNTAKTRDVIDEMLRVCQDALA